MPRCQQHFKDDCPGCADRPWTSAVLLVVMYGLLLLILAVCTVSCVLGRRQPAGSSSSARNGQPCVALVGNAAGRRAPGGVEQQAVCAASVPATAHLRSGDSRSAANFRPTSAWAGTPCARQACRRAFQPRRSGGRAQRFCSPACRRRRAIGRLQDAGRVLIVGNATRHAVLYAVKGE